MANPPVSRRSLLGGAGAAVVGLSLPSTVSAATSAPAPAADARPRLPLRLLTRMGLPQSTLDQIAAISPQITVITRAGAEQYSNELPQADAIFGHLSGEDVSAAKKLRWVQYNAAGVEHLPLSELISSDVMLTNARGCHSSQIAEHAFGLLFGLTRNIAAYARNGQRHFERPIELRGMTVGIVGLGAIGREVARRAKAMDMHVLAIDEQPMFVERYRMADEITSPDGLHDMLKRSDVVVIAAPHTPRSEGMIGEREFALMKPTTYFISVSRGKLTRTDALLSALKEKRIAGAGLDVTNPEPLPADHPLWKEPNVIITPHIAGQSQFTEDRVQQVLAENVRRYANGLPLMNLVDKQMGY